MSAKAKDDLDKLKVYIRERPMTQAELQSKRKNVVQEISSKEVVIKTGATRKKYNFAHVFDKSAAQEDVYNVVVAPMIDLVFSGHTCTVFAYGQTGTGKTYTLMGKDRGGRGFLNDSSDGIIPRASQDLCAELNKRNVMFSMSVSFVEVYNEEVYNLLLKHSPALQVCDDPDVKGFSCIKAVLDKSVETVEDIFEQLKAGAAERHRGLTNLNRLSSRSNSIFTIDLKTRVVTDGEEIITTGKLCFVDLAGSENMGKSRSSKSKKQDLSSINKSIITFGKVLKAVAANMNFVPYTESKLTRILEDSLGGNSVTIMIATFSPCIHVLDATLRTLEFGRVVRNVEICPVVNINRRVMDPSKESEEHIFHLRDRLEAVMTGEGFCMLQSTYDRLHDEIKTKYERVIVLNREIKHLERHIAKHKKAFEESRILGLQNNFALQNFVVELAEVKADLKDDMVLRCLVRAELEALMDSQKDLQDLYGTFTDEDDVCFELYEVEYDTDFKNAIVARDMQNLSNTFVNEAKIFFDRFHGLQNTRFGDIRVILSGMEKIRVHNLNEFGKIDSRMILCTAFWDLSSDMFKNTPYNDIERYITVLLRNTFQARLKNAVEITKVTGNVKEIVVDTITELDAQTEKCGQSIDVEIAQGAEIAANLSERRRRLREILEKRKKQNEIQLLANRRLQDLHRKLIEETIAETEETERELELLRLQKEEIDLEDTLSENALKTCSIIKDFLDTWTVALERSSELLPVIEDARNFIRNSAMTCQKELDSYQCQSMEYFKGFIHTLETNVVENDDDFLCSGKTWMKKLNLIKENLKRLEGEYLKGQDAQLETVLLNMTTFEDDLKEFKKVSMQDMENFANEVTLQAQVKDTPVKTEQEPPKELPESESLDAKQTSTSAPDPDSPKPL